MKTVAVIGTGPAGLMAAHELCAAGFQVRVFEKRKSAGRKLLVAGSSGLNITYDAPLDEFIANYRGPGHRMDPVLRAYPPTDWIAFIEGLGIPTFKGTSRRYFVEEMKASGLLKAWVSRLESQGVLFEYGKEFSDYESSAGGVSLQFTDGSAQKFSAVCFALGGGSWEKNENPLRWPELFKRKGVAFAPFVSSNVGFQVDWPAGLLKEAEGQPIKNVVLRSSRGSRAGDLVITSYGLEGTPIYFAGEVESVTIDLKPDLTAEQLIAKLQAVKENLSPMRRAKKQLALGPGALALIYHLGDLDRLYPGEAGIEALAKRLKAFPVKLKARQPLDEAISSSGGIRWDEVDEFLMLRNHPGVFLAGEMLDWDAPTGGFLIQGCVALGVHAARSIAQSLMPRIPTEES